MKEVIEYIIKSLVETPDDVEISIEKDKEINVIKILVNPSDMGKVIGRNGKIAQSIRTIVKSLANKSGMKCAVKIDEKNN